MPSQETGSLSPDDPTLRTLAAKYSWWQSPEEAVKRPEPVVAQVMNLGDFDDARALIARLGEGPFVHVLRTAEAGQFTPARGTSV